MHKPLEPTTRAPAAPPKRWSLQRAGALLALYTAALVPFLGWFKPGYVQLLDWSTGPARGFSHWIGGVWGLHLPAGPGPFLVSALSSLVSPRLVGPALALVLAAVLTAGSVSLADHVSRSPQFWSRLCSVMVVAGSSFVALRLAAGQVAVVWMVGALAGLCAAAFSMGTIKPVGGTKWHAPWVRVGLWWALAAAGSLHALWLGAVVVSVVVVFGPQRRALLQAGVYATATCVALCATWVVPGLVLDPLETPAIGDLSAFATYARARLGVPLTAAFTDGFWRGDITSWLEISPAAVVVASLVLTLSMWGLWGLPRRSRWLTLGLTSWLLSLGAWGPLSPVWRWAYDNVPGWSVMREANKFAAITLVVLAAGAVGALTRSHGRLRWGVIAVAACWWAFGAAGSVSSSQAVQVPPSWDQTLAVMRDHGLCGRTGIWPPQRYTDPGYTGSRSVDSPAQAWFGSCVRALSDQEVDDLIERGQLPDLDALLVLRPHDIEGPTSTLVKQSLLARASQLTDHSPQIWAIEPGS